MVEVEAWGISFICKAFCSHEYDQAVEKGNLENNTNVFSANMSLKYICLSKT